MDIKINKNLPIFLLSLTPGLLVNILIMKTGHDVKTTYSCYENIPLSQEYLGWILSNITINEIYISNYLNYFLLFLSQTYLFFIYNKSLKINPLIYIGLLNCTYPLLNIHSNILKQGFAMSFTIFCLCCFLSKQRITLKIINIIIFSFLAYFCHNSSALILIIFLLSLLATYSIKFKPLLIFYKNQRFIYNIKFSTTIALISLFLLILILGINGYIIRDNSLSFVSLYLTFFISYLYLSKDKYLQSRNTIILHNFILFFIVLIFGFTIFEFNQSVIERLSLYILPVIIVSIMSISSFVFKKNNLKYYLGILLILFLMTYSGGFYAIEDFYKC